MLTTELLKKDKKEKLNKIKKIYKQILELLYEKIKKLNLQRYKSYTYQPPRIIMENPTYNQNQAYIYIYKKLCEGGFNVKPMQDNILEISW